MKKMMIKKVLAAALAAAMFCTAQASVLYSGTDRLLPDTAFAAGEPADAEEDDPFAEEEQQVPAVIGAVLPEKGFGASLNAGQAGASVTKNDASGDNPVMSDEPLIDRSRFNLPAGDPDKIELTQVYNWNGLKDACGSSSSPKKAYLLVMNDIRATDLLCITVIAGKDITIDLNGHRIDADRNSPAADGHLFWNKGNLRITDSRGGGMLSTGYANNGGAVNGAEGSVTQLDHIKFWNNRAKEKGGAVQNYGDMTVSDCVFWSCSSGTYGGAISNCVTSKNSNPTLTVRHCTFYQCKTGTGGGGIWSDGTVTLEECLFRECRATNGSTGSSSAGRGGGFSTFGRVTGTGLTFENCTSACEGGGAWFGTLNYQKAKGTLKDCLFKQCSSISQVNDGGGICLKEDAELAVYDSMITGCRARDGGGIWSKGRITLSGSVIASCAAAKAGGAVTSHRTGDFINVTVRDCTAVTGAAGIQCSKNGDPKPSNKMTNCSFTDCTAGDAASGGAIYNEGNLWLKELYAAKCKANKGGFLCSAETASLTNVYIEDCTANLGGGIANYKDMTADKLTVKNCKSNTNGGALCLAKDKSNPALTAKNCLISGNTAGANGGGIYAEQVGSVTVSGYNAIEKNIAQNDGGGIWLKDGTMNISGGTLSENEASGGGAGMWSKGTAVLSGLTVSGNKKAVNGGGLTNHGTMTVSGCSVTGNAVSGSGGGIYLGQDGKAFRLTGRVTVSGNTAQTGGGIYTANEYGGTFEMQDKVVVSGNLKHDVKLESGKLITITGTLAKGSSVGICPGGYNVKVLKGYGLYNFSDPDLYFYVTDCKSDVHISNVLDFNDVSVSDKADEKINYQAEIWFTGRLAASFQNVRDAWTRAFQEGKSRGASEKITVKLLCDWTADADGFPSAFSENGAIKVAGCHIELDLNGHILSRGLNKEQKYGHLFTVCGGAVLSICDSSPETRNFGYGITGGILTGGHSDKTAGCIEMEHGAKVNFNGGSIVSCHSDKVGGAIRMADGGTLNVDGGGFYTNRETNGGGAAIYCSQGTINMNRAVFEGNYTTEKGGAVYLDNAKLEARDCIFRANKSEDQGGALYITGGDSDVNCDGCIFTECSSGDDGGSAYVNKCRQVYFSNSSFSGSYAADTGGAIHADYDNVVLNSTTIVGCKAKKGGAVFVYAHKDIGMQGRVIIRDNHNLDGKDDNVVLEWRTVTIKAYINNGGLYEGSEIHVHSDTSGETRIAKNISLSQQKYFVADNGSTKTENLTEKKELFVSSVIGSGSLVVIFSGLMVLVLAVSVILIIRKLSAKKQKGEV